MLKEQIMTEGESFVEYSTFTVQNKVLFDSGKEDYIIISVVAENKYEAADIAKDWLLSRKAFLVKEVLGQSFRAASSVLIKRVGK